MAWWLGFALIALAGFLFEGEIARYIPFTELTIRQTMIGSLAGLAAGYTIRVFERIR